LTKKKTKNAKTKFHPKVHAELILNCSHATKVKVLLCICTLPLKLMHL